MILIRRNMWTRDDLYSVIIILGYVNLVPYLSRVYRGLAWAAQYSPEGFFFVQFLVVFLVVWLVFAVTAFYVSNVTLWGWRRVVVGHDVFVDKGFRPGQVPLVLGGDDLLPGELICGKWDNARSVLRRIAGNPGPERSASEKEDEVQ